jgi:hypothetical protein
MGRRIGIWFVQPFLVEYGERLAWRFLGRRL